MVHVMTDGFLVPRKTSMGQLERGARGVHGVRSSPSPWDPALASLYIILPTILILLRTCVDRLHSHGIYPFPDEETKAARCKVN